MRSLPRILDEVCERFLDSWHLLMIPTAYMFVHKVVSDLISHTSTLYAVYTANKVSPFIGWQMRISVAWMYLPNIILQLIMFDVFFD
jgi:hypothetical protein